jgi:hypothetical protein
MATVSPLFCTDEDIIIETPDFWTLCPPNQVDAYGKDGVITAETPWVLTSAVVDFASIGVRPNTVICLSRPEEVFGGEPGEAYIVDHILEDDPHSLYLRRAGREIGAGDPPGNGVDDIPGVEFTIRTLYGQIKKASEEIDEEYGITEYSGGAALVDADARLVRDLTTYLVLERRYMAVSQGTEIPGAKERYMEKSKYYKARLTEIGGRVQIRFVGGGVAAPLKRRWTRIV